MLIRRADPRDLVALEALEAQAWGPGTTPAPGPPPGRQLFGDVFSWEDILVAEIDGQVAGYLALGQRTPLPSNRHVGRIRSVAVAPQQRRQGVARVLLEAGEREARQRGFRKLNLSVLGSNDAALRLYTSAGYVVEGRLREEYLLEDGRLVDDVIMAKPLPG